MNSLADLVLYACGIVFLAGTIVRAIRYQRQPIHLRWEIYPVPEGHTGQLKVMVPEILFLKALYENNRSLWYVSYPFHLGLYLLVGAAAALAVGLSSVAGAVSTAGFVLVLGGSLGLLVRRFTSRELKIYTTAGDILNLVWFAMTAILLLAGFLWQPALLPAGTVVGGLLLAYIPMTHMAHFVGKYFTYHGVRWDDRAAAKVGQRMTEYLTYRPTWSAPHIQADGSRTWSEIATSPVGAAPVRHRSSGK